MIAPLTSSLLRVIVFWYSLGAAVLFLGSPDWAGLRYERLMALLPVPALETSGIVGAATVQWHLLVYWTTPVLALWLASILTGSLSCEVRFRIHQYLQRMRLRPRGEFRGVTVASYSIGRIPLATVPKPTRQPVQILSSFSPRRLLSNKRNIQVVVAGRVREVMGWLTPQELALSQEIISVLFTSPTHYAGAGHGVGLLEHTLNVLEEASKNCTENFCLPVIAALAHDVGKLLTFQPDIEHSWKRVGLHSRESARILATLLSFELLPLVSQRGLLLAVKYDHAPSKMPLLAQDKESGMLALRIINALSRADRAATAAEKDRHLERIQPEDILWRDFVDFLREAPVTKRGKTNVANQINNPMDSPYLYIYEAPWRDAAVQRLPAEVAAALDLTRRDNGHTAKYTRILVERLRKEDLLLEELRLKDGTVLKPPKHNPLWDIRSGSAEKGIEFRGVLVLHAEALWKKLNYRLGTWSPYPVTILAPNAGESKPPPSDAQLGLKSDEENICTSRVQSGGLNFRNRLLRRTQSTSAPPAPVQSELTSAAHTSADAPEAAQLGSEVTTNTEYAQTDSTRCVETTNETTSLACATPNAHKKSSPRQPEQDTGNKPTALSRSEKNLGVLIADEAAMAKYPHLTLDQKYYGSESHMVLAGAVVVGTPYREGKASSVPDTSPHQAQQASDEEAEKKRTDSERPFAEEKAPKATAKETDPIARPRIDKPAGTACLEPLAGLEHSALSLVPRKPRRRKFS